MKQMKAIHSSLFEGGYEMSHSQNRGAQTVVTSVFFYAHI